MQDIVLIGLNHNTAPVELRECIAFSEGDTQAALARLADIPVLDEALLLSTGATSSSSTKDLVRFTWK